MPLSSLAPIRTRFTITGCPTVAWILVGLTRSLPAWGVAPGFCVSLPSSDLLWSPVELPGSASTGVLGVPEDGGATACPAAKGDGWGPP